MEAAMQVTTEAGAPQDWGEILARAEGATFCHLPGWRRVMEGAMGHEYLFLSARAGDGRLLGGLPLVRMRSRVFGHHLVSGSLEDLVVDGTFLTSVCTVGDCGSGYSSTQKPVAVGACTRLYVFTFTRV